MAVTVLFDGEVSQDYHQFYLCDGSLPSLPDDYTDAAIARRVMAGRQAIIVHVEREMPVPVRVELHDRRPQLDLATLDHAVATAFSAPSGVLVLAGLLDYVGNATRLAVPAGRLAVIVTFAALGSLSEDGLEGEDHYAIHLWPDPDASAEIVVLEAFAG